jgi:hypothetical protein
MSEGIHTLQEFMFQTKGIIYILGVGFLIGFFSFLKFLHARGGDP